MPLSQSSRSRLTCHTLPDFAGDTLYDAIGRVVCEAECLPRKEFFEAWAVAKRVRRRITGRPILDLAAGHGLLAWMLLILDVNTPSARCVDRRRPESAYILERALTARWPRLAGKLCFEEGDVRDVAARPEELVVSVHACGTLTDVTLDVALSARAPVAVLPCCHSQAKCDAAGLAAWMDLGVAVDAVRALRLRAAGYAVNLTTIPVEITPQNRLIIAEPSAS